jgi:hypothetical protein
VSGFRIDLFSPHKQLLRQLGRDEPSTFSEFRKHGRETFCRSQRVEGRATLSAANANGGTSPMVSHDKNSHDIANDTKQEMIRESL